MTEPHDQATSPTKRHDDNEECESGSHILLQISHARPFEERSSTSMLENSGGGDHEGLRHNTSSYLPARASPSAVTTSGPSSSTTAVLSSDDAPNASFSSTNFPSQEERIWPSYFLSKSTDVPALNEAIRFNFFSEPFVSQMTNLAVSTQGDASVTRDISRMPFPDIVQKRRMLRDIIQEAINLIETGDDFIDEKI